MAKRTYRNDVSIASDEWNERGARVSGKVSGFSITASLDVAEDAVTFKSTLPLVARMRRGSVEKRMRRELERILRS